MEILLEETMVLKTLLIQKGQKRKQKRGEK